MRTAALAAAPIVVLAAALAAAQDPAPVYQQQPKKSFRFAGDTLARYEWTRNIPGEDGLADESRYRIQLRPRLELSLGPIELGVGGEFNYSDDENDKPPAGQDTLTLVRDNYRSRDARLDLAYGKLKLGPFVAQGGRFFMPIPLTEMIWDRDLRPQGGAVALEYAPKGSETHIALNGIYAKGSHVFEDESVMYGGALELKFAAGTDSSLQLVGSYLQFQDLNELELAIRRQNTRFAGLITGDYHVVDLIGRISRGGQLPLQLIGDYCWNTAVDEQNKGLWLAAVLGALGTSRAAIQYTYAKIDRDATVAAFNTDDFYWGTGWEGHRADLGTGTVKSSSIHAIAQWQRFKDSPDPTVREQWVTRYRLEWRTSF
jgi:hypothetical protein